MVYIILRSTQNEIVEYLCISGDIEQTELTEHDSTHNHDKDSVFTFTFVANYCEQTSDGRRNGKSKSYTDPLIYYLNRTIEY